METMRQVESPEGLLSIWPSLTPKEQSSLLHLLQGVSDPLYWMQHCTKTKDEQDVLNPYKPFPNRPYFKDLHEAWEKEAVLFIEKSRTLLCTWWGAAECLHLAMRRPATRVLLMAQDEDRSLVPLDYCWTLWEQQDAPFRQIWPLDRPREKQCYNVMELKNESSIMALPGKEPSKIRGFHPTVIFMDETASMDSFGEAFDIAVATRVPKIVCVSSADISEYENLIKTAEPVDWYA